MEKSYFKQVLSYALSGIITATSLFGVVAGAAGTSPSNDAQTKAQYEPGVTISEQADEHGLYDVTFTVDVSSLGFDTTENPAQDVYLYGSFARYPTNVSNWTSTHSDDDEEAKMEDWWLTALQADKTIKDVIIPSDYADGSHLDDTAPLEQPTYAQKMDPVGDGLYSVTLKLPSSPYFYRYAVNPTFTLTTDSAISTSHAIKDDKKAYTITADYLSYDPMNPSVSNPAADHIQGKSMIVVGDGDYYHKDDSVAKGSVSFVPYTDVNGNTRYLGVYLPAGYDANGAAYKTLYMSHGMGGDETEWMNKGRVQDVFDYAIAKGNIEPTIVITMDNTADYNWDLATIRKNLMEYIIPFVESHYNVSDNVKDRAMMGLSMGGVTTSYVYMNESNSFGYFVVLSGATPQNEDLYPLSKVSHDAKLLVGAGEEDFGWGQTPTPGSFGGVKHWMDDLDAAGIEYTEMNVPGTHDWYTWSQLLENVVSDFLWKDEAETDGNTPFTDVKTGDYYYDAVLWAVENDITNGTTATSFGPNENVSRAQMVTFLWRAAGAPKATGTNPFTDINADDYYYDAVLWATSNNVTNGTAETTFSPNDPVSRAQAVTFQWRAAGSPTASGNGFTDIASDAYYADAVTWAVENEITNGMTETTFAPDITVSRAQAVTFLYRAA